MPQLSTEQPETRAPWLPFGRLAALRDSDARVIAGTASRLAGMTIAVAELGADVASWRLMDDEIGRVLAARAAQVAA